MIKISKNVPIHPKKSKVASSRGHRPLKYPWNKMEIGDSIFVKNTTAGSILSSANSYARTHSLKWKFTSREMGDGIRIWRIK